RASASSGHSLYGIETELLADLNPDVILTQEQCTVCAVDLDRTVCALETLGLKSVLVSLSANNFAELYDDILTVGEATAHTTEAQNLVITLQRRVARVVKLVSSRPRPRVFCLSWFDPLMSAGNWITEMVRISGADPRLGSNGK